MSEIDGYYPGSDAGPKAVCSLADRYRTAAAILDYHAPRGALASAPFRLTALPAIELYLNALLLREGHSPEVIRGLQHRLRHKLELAMRSGFELDSNTVEHIGELEDRREYLISRYDPEHVRQCSPTTRLTATLRKIGDKVQATLAA